MTDQTATRDQIRAAAGRAAATLTEHPRDGWMCWAGSRHTDGPCKACVAAEERRAAQAVTG
jgi:hypothetical protein